MGSGSSLVKQGSPMDNNSGGGMQKAQLTGGTESSLLPVITDRDLVESGARLTRNLHSLRSGVRGTLTLSCRYAATLSRCAEDIGGDARATTTTSCKTQ